MSIPDFIVIGAQRAGTTWLYRCLKQHPQVKLPKEKEIHYFDLNYQKGPVWYADMLGSEKSGLLLGDITPNYYQYPGALDRIKKECPKSKIIYILREPVSRLISQYELFKDNNFKGLTLSQAMRSNPVMMDLSLQGKSLAKALELFEREKVLVLLYDELQDNPVEFLKKIYIFLGINEGFRAEGLGDRVNKVVFPKLQIFMDKYKLGWLIELIKLSPAAEPLKRISGMRRDNKKYRFFKEDIDKFSDDIEIIETLLCMDLSHWREGLKKWV